MLLWCAWNQRWASVTGSTVPLEGANTKMRMMMGEDAERIQRSTARIQNLSLTDEHWTQTGYKVTIVGMTLYYLVILTHLIIQFLLLALTVEYCEFYYFSCVISSNHCAFLYTSSFSCLVFVKMSNKNQSPHLYSGPNSFTTKNKYSWRSKSPGWWGLFGVSF